MPEPPPPPPRTEGSPTRSSEVSRRPGPRPPGRNGKRRGEAKAAFQLGGWRRPGRASGALRSPQLLPRPPGRAHVAGPEAPGSTLTCSLPRPRPPSVHSPMHLGGPHSESRISFHSPPRDHSPVPRRSPSRPRGPSPRSVRLLHSALPRPTGHSPLSAASAGLRPG